MGKILLSEKVPAAGRSVVTGLGHGGRERPGFPSRAGLGRTGGHLPRRHLRHRQLDPQIALDSSGYSHVVWTGFNGRNQIYYATNEGGSWSEPLLISTNSFDNGSPQIAMGAGDQVHVVWDGYDPG